MFSKTSSHLSNLKFLCHYKHMNDCFEQFSFEIFQFLEKCDLNNLRITNKFFYDLCECHFIISDSFKGLESLMINPISEEKPIKKSKFREKYDFNKSMKEYYKGSEKLKERIESGRKKK